ncbi:hypothetical protein LZ24_02501 [Desulfobotulus alkaliphilus]|uniref:Uncharacterized protein n=1 Tax=Desulfobotulus alkaliphilus TaxID=622671 RepID=A0A562RHF4_9BACT|nr:hypothetical protein LZ24_02501 [Desulfobotulus alkaliphilus]
MFLEKYPQLNRFTGGQILSTGSEETASASNHSPVTAGLPTHTGATRDGQAPQAFEEGVSLEAVNSVGTTGVREASASNHSSVTAGLPTHTGVTRDGQAPGCTGQTHWRDFPAVVALSEFLRSKPMGISLARDPHWRIILRARPGVTPEEPERWEFYRQALALAETALPDLYELMDHGRMGLPLADPHGNQRR